MKKLLRTLIALSICLSGWALVPVVSLPAQSFSWELFADAYGEIFSDGFESGETDSWSNVVGQIQSWDADSSEDLLLSFLINDASWPTRSEEPIVLASGVSDRGAPTFILEGRRMGGQFGVRGRAVSQPNVWVESPWRELDQSDGMIELEWRRAHEQVEDGLLYLSVGGHLLLWLVDLDNRHLPLRQIHQRVYGGEPAIAVTSGNIQSAE